MWKMVCERVQALAVGLGLALLVIVALKLIPSPMPARPPRLGSQIATGVETPAVFDSQIATVTRRRPIDLTPPVAPRGFAPLPAIPMRDRAHGVDAATSAASQADGTSPSEAPKSTDDASPVDGDDPSDSTSPRVPRIAREPARLLPLQIAVPNRQDQPAFGNGPVEDVPQIPIEQLELLPEERVAVEIYERCNLGVVNISTKASKVEGWLLLEQVSEGAGSGVVLDHAGHVLTNFHVIEGANRVTVTLHDSSSYDAVFVGADPVNDVAVIRIPAPQELLVPVPIGDSARLRVGMRVFAIGNPFGLERTLTTGIVSSLNRSLRIRENRMVKSIIQIDAAINPGSSGGPLIDSHGRLIGMNTAIATTTGQSSGVGFAIPVNLISRIVPQLIANGKVARPDIGITKVYETERGLLVAGLAPGGPAEVAGLRAPGVVQKRRVPFVMQATEKVTPDLIVGVDGKRTRTADEFLDYIERKQAGEAVEVIVMREGRFVPVRITLRLGE